MFTNHSAKDFATLTHSLKLNSGFEAASFLIEAHLRKVHHILLDFIAQDEFVTEELKESLSGLPNSSILRLVSSPYLCELLMINQENSAPELRQQIVQGLVAEILLIDPSFDFSIRPCWTFDGDVVLDPDIALTFPALQTNCGIRLNYQSYAHNTGKPGIGGYNREMALRHKERIELGKEMILQGSRGATSLVDTFTVAIQFRMNKNRPNTVNSSTHTSIGLIRCDNFHNLHDDMPEVIDMLVHESIHQYLHLFEEQLFSFVDTTRISAARLEERIFPSPWSGHELDLRSYTHAILVWYGLWHFWRQMERSGFTNPELNAESIRQKINEAAVGFLKAESVLTNLDEARSALHPDYAGEIEQLQKEIRACHLSQVVQSA